MQKIKKYKDISGKIFYDSAGNQTCQALKYVGKDSRGNAKWLFKCFVNGPGCKGTFVARADSVKRGGTVSCGCHRKLKASETHTTHGMSGTPEYRSWCNMNDRCDNPNHPDYHNYGGRGIKVCWRWHKDNPDGFKNFLADMGPMPGPGYSVERKDNDLDYSPDNCKWLKKNLQPRNRNYNVIDDIEEAEFIRDLHKLGHSGAKIARAVAAAKGKSCSSSTIYNIINNKRWTP